MAKREFSHSVYVDGMPHFSANQVDAMINRAVNLAVDKEYVRVIRYYNKLFDSGKAVYHG